MHSRFLAVTTASLAFVCLLRLALAANPEPRHQTPILLYHRFGPTAADSMTVSTRALDSQLATIRQGGYRVIALREFVESILSGKSLPPRSIVITVDDDDESIYTEMAPRLKRYGFPATFFVYPSAISHAKWAMTWPQLIEMEKTGLFDVESHTYWHPNFKVEKRRLTNAAYKNLVDWQLEHPKQILEQKLAKRIDLLSWPFGIYDDWLMNEARQAGYRAAFTLDRRSAKTTDLPMAFPRYLMTDSQRGPVFERLLAQATAVTAR